MKKIYIAIVLCFASLSLFVVSCNKDNPIQSTTEVKPDPVKFIDNTPKVKINSFSDLKANVEVIDGVLHFKTKDDFENVINFLSNSKKEEIYKWEKTLSGFTSVQKYLDIVKNEFKTDTLNQNKFQELKTKYNGKVNFIDKNERIKPLIENGHVFGRIIGLKGQYKVDETLMQYFENKVITIANGDLSKLEKAKQNLQSDPQNGIYIHDLKINLRENLNGLGTRGFNYCSDGCPEYQFDENKRDIDGERYWLTQEYQFVDNSGGQYVYTYNSLGEPVVFLEVNIKISVEIDIEQRRQRWWLGFSPTYGGFSWGFGFGLDLSASLDGTTYLPPYGTFAINNGHVAGGFGWVVNDSDLEITHFFWNTTLISNNWYAGINTCIRRTGLRSESNYGPSILFNSQYCQK